ncbi:uncharacterized protein LOC143427546 [Xylocopa sonorina]|uniref:uncharacterized protein LOC143427546 n=1 Tax=Xylocopa sonorina TaxID=1818115 RepID=UPI00403B30C1
MLTQEWLLVCLIMGSATALTPDSNPTMEESLRTALDAITRKQRSLDTNSQEYYNDLHSFKYHGGEGDRERQGERDMEEDDEEIEFLPNETGQLETVGSGFQDVNNRLLERAMLDYLEDTMPLREEPVTSLFRERERSSSRKRGSGSERLNIDNKELAKLFIEELQDGSPYNIEDGDEDRYKESRQTLYDPYTGNRGGNKLNLGPMSWGELFNKESMVREQGREIDENEYGDREQDPNMLYLSMGERRNVNGGYPVARPMRIYSNMAKRYPVAKRSLKTMTTKKQVTDPKVAQDLGTLFGTQSTDNQNRSYVHSHDHEHGHDHSHDHDHDREHGNQGNNEGTSEAPKVTPAPKGQKENVTKLGKSKTIEVRKKSVDWSQYFGIDKRKKKATLVPGEGTQNQDDEWMLQRYYQNMAENLKANDRDYEKEGNERKDKLDQLDPKQKNIKDLIIEKALKYVDSDDINLQKLENKVIARLAAAYSAEKMRKALNELRNNVAARIESQKAAHAQGNQSGSTFRENSNNSKSKDKRTNNNLIETEGMEENRACPELEAIEKRCRTVGGLAGDESEMLYLPCVMLQICKACVQYDLEEECLENYAVEAGKVCDAQEIREGAKGREACASTALILSLLQSPAAVSDQCRLDGNDSCLRRYHYRYLQRYLRNPYGRRLNNGYVLI